MGQKYSSTKPINRLYSQYINSAYHDLDSIADQEWVTELRQNVREALDKISTDYKTTLLQQLNKSDPRSSEPLVAYYMKKIILALSASSYIKRVRIALAEEHTEEDIHEHTRIYQDILDLIFRVIQSTRLTKTNRKVKRVIYQDAFMYETALDKLTQKYFTPATPKATSTTTTASAPASPPPRKTLPKRQGSATILPRDEDIVDIS